MVGLLLCTSFSAALFAMASSSREDILFPSSTDSGGHVSIVLPYSIDATDIRSIKQRIFLHPNVVSRGCVRDIVHVHEPSLKQVTLGDCGFFLRSNSLAHESLDVALASNDKSCPSAFRCLALCTQAGAATNATDNFGNDAQAYRSRNLRRSNDPPLATTAPPAGESHSEAGPAGVSCCRRLLCCLRRNRVHGDPLEAPLRSAVSASSGSGS